MRVEVRLMCVETKVDGIATDLAAHRAGTVTHPGGVYRVREVSGTRGMRGKLKGCRPPLALGGEK